MQWVNMSRCACVPNRPTKPQRYTACFTILPSPSEGITFISPIQRIWKICSTHEQCEKNEGPELQGSFRENMLKLGEIQGITHIELILRDQRERGNFICQEERKSTFPTKKPPCAQQESQCARRLKERIARKGGLEEGALPKCNFTSCTQIESCRGNT